MKYNVLTKSTNFALKSSVHSFTSFTYFRYHFPASFVLMWLFTTCCDKCAICNLDRLWFWLLPMTYDVHCCLQIHSSNHKWFLMNYRNVLFIFTFSVFIKKCQVRIYILCRSRMCQHMYERVCNWFITVSTVFVVVGHDIFCFWLITYFATIDVMFC